MDLNFKGEHALWLRLLNAATPEEVRAVCDESPYWLNPKHGAIMFHDLLSGNAKGFLAAMQDRRWPKSERPTREGGFGFWHAPWRGSRWESAFVPDRICWRRRKKRNLKRFTGRCAFAAIVREITKLQAVAGTALARIINTPAEAS
jgi:hypothetical protein